MARSTFDHLVPILRTSGQPANGKHSDHGIHFPEHTTPANRTPCR
jgi:hypothetical protein